MMRDGDVSKILDRLGIEHSQRGRELMGKCPGHRKATGREDHNPSWSINEETGAHHCFSCGYKGSILTLVADLLQLENLDDAKSWISANAPVDLEALSQELAALRRESNIYVPRPVPMSEARLAVFSDPPEWALKERALSLEACLHHKVRWENQTDAWITPIRDPEDFHLLGWQQKGQGNRYFRNRPAGLKKAGTLFGIEHYADLSLNDMIVVESPLDVVRLTSIGIRGGVSTFGASVSDEQIKLMRRAERIVIAMDNDDAGRKSNSHILKVLRRYGMECWFFDYSHTDAKDIGDMTAAEIESGLVKARHCVMGLAAISQ
jgi:5S rRNA maturation endonuclease (ribonuclease M5)